MIVGEHTWHQLQEAEKDLVEADQDGEDVRQQSQGWGELQEEGELGRKMGRRRWSPSSPSSSSSSLGRRKGLGRRRWFSRGGETRKGADAGLTPPSGSSCHFLFLLVFWFLH